MWRFYIILKLNFSFFLFFCFFTPLFAQTVSLRLSNSVPLASEISRLEKVSYNANEAAEWYNATINLVRLFRLSGNQDAALDACAKVLVHFPGDGRTLLEQARLLISIGEHEKAALALNAMLTTSQDREFQIQGRYLAGLLEAFRFGSTQALTALASDPDYTEYRSGIYYTVWKFSALALWKDRLISEFPHSPEAKIAGGSVNAAPTPLWLLFPGRENITISSSAPPQAPSSQATSSQPTQATQTATPATTTAVSNSQPTVPTTQSALEPGVVLQTGLFSREQNALALSERLKKAGFDPHISQRQVNGNEYWAVYVPAGNDMNAAIMKLKDAGFESFPVR